VIAQALAWLSEPSNPSPARQPLAFFYKKDASMTQKTLCMFALAALLVTDASAQQFVYPAKGQTPQQQQSDEAACYSWAVQQSGFDPARPAPAAPPPAAAPQPATTPTGTTPGAGVAGAVGGAVIGGIAGDAGAGAAVGAVVARSASRRKNAAAQQQAASQQQAAAQQQQAGTQQQQATFGKARAACLEGRGYTVK
jgi:hypothetical protein